MCLLILLANGAANNTPPPPATHLHAHTNTKDKLTPNTKTQHKTRNATPKVVFTARDPPPAELYGCPVVGIGYGAFADDVEVT